jgi:hypothetical protein
MDAILSFGFGFSFIVVARVAAGAHVPPVARWMKGKRDHEAVHDR